MATAASQHQEHQEPSDRDWIIPSAHDLYVEQIIPSAVRVTRRARLQRFALNHSLRFGGGTSSAKQQRSKQPAAQPLRLQFGVYKGQDLAKLAAFLPEAPFHGFDSFRGLPEPFAKLPEGHFDLGGEAPAMLAAHANVELHAGMFAETLPGFLATHPEPCAFVHCTFK